MAKHRRGKPQVLITRRVKVRNFNDVKATAVKFNDEMKRAGCFPSMVYRAESDLNDVLFLMDWTSHDAFNPIPRIAR